jgi:hypothetical protein
VGDDASTPRRTALVAAGVAGLLLGGLLLWWWSRPPQMGADGEVSRAVDALFTAVTARDEKRLAECERRLRALQEAGKLPGAAAGYLDSIIRTARTGGWETAARSLYDFMRAQRREGGEDHPARKGGTGTGRK